MSRSRQNSKKQSEPSFVGHPVCTCVEIQSVSTATLLRLVSTAVHVTVRLLRGDCLWHFVSTEAFLGVLHAGVFVAFLRASLHTEGNGVLVRVVGFVGENPGTILIILVAKAGRSTVNPRSEIITCKVDL